MLKGRTPTKAEREHMDAVCNVGCIVCLEWLGVHSPAEPHHTTGKTKAGAHMLTIPLCPRHHRTPGRGYISRHGNGKAAFEREYATERELLDMTLLHLERVERLSV